MLGFRFMIQPSFTRLTGIMVFCLAVGTSYSSTSWPNEPAGATVIADCQFSGSICPPMFNQYKSGSFVVDPTAPTGGTNQVLDDYMPAGTSVGSGSGVWGASFSPLAREVYTGAWWKTNADFEGSQNNGNKLWYVGGAPGNNSIFMWTGPQGLGTPRTVHFVFQTVEDNCHIVGDCSSPWSGALVPNVNAAVATVKPGSGWHQLELYQKASSTSTSRDGIIRWWVDGVLCGNYTNLNYSPGGFDNVQINHAWDGTHVRNQSLEWHHYWDQMRWSIPNCGTGGCPAPAYLLINSSLPPARTGTPFTATLTADGGTKPYSWSLQSGKLPTGLSLNQSTGVISGTPTCVGRSDFTIRVTDGSSPVLSATKSYTIITSGTGTCTSGMEDNRESPFDSHRQGSGQVAQDTREAESQKIGVGSRAGSVRFSLPAASGAQYRLSVYDLAGKKVYDHASMGQKETSFVTNLKSGVYVVKFSQGQKTSTVRFNVMN